MNALQTASDERQVREKRVRTHMQMNIKVGSQHLNRRMTGFYRKNGLRKLYIARHKKNNRIS